MSFRVPEFILTRARIDAQSKLTKGRRLSAPNAGPLFIREDSALELFEELENRLKQTFPTFSATVRYPILVNSRHPSQSETIHDLMGHPSTDIEDAPTPLHHEGSFAFS